MTVHHYFSPSAAPYWLKCPARIARTKSLGVRRPAGPEANYGTVAHTLAHLCLTQGTQPKDYLGQAVDKDFPAILVDQEMVKVVGYYMEMVLDMLLQYPGAKMDLEQHGLLTLEGFEGFRNSCGGTVDCRIRAKKQGVLIIADLKTGERHQVRPDSEQLKIYALASVPTRKKLLKFREVHLVIIQPRGAGDRFRRHITTPQDLLDWADGELHPAMVAGEVPVHLAKGVPGRDQCKWCDYLPHCPEVANLAQDLPDVPGRSFRDLSALTLASNLDRADVLAVWLKAVNDTAFQYLKRHGGQVDGFPRKLVAGRGSRVWTLPDRLMAAVLVANGWVEDPWEAPALKSPAQMEKLVDRDTLPALLDWMDKKPGNPIMADAADPRPVYQEFTKEDLKDED